MPRFDGAACRANQAIVAACVGICEQHLTVVAVRFSGLTKVVVGRARRRTRREFASVMSSCKIRLGLDIGGTFTDVALEVGERRFTAKTLTTSSAPEDGVLTAMSSATAQAGIEPQQVGLVVHGTTLATNAVIERKGARTALLTTEGFRDV